MESFEIIDEIKCIRKEIDEAQVKMERRRDEFQMKKAEHENHMASCEAKLQELKASLNELPIDKLVQLIDEKSQPEIIPVRDEGEQIFLLRSPVMPEFAFVLWARGNYDREPFMSLDLQGVSSRAFYFVTNTDDPEIAGFEKPEGVDTDSWTADMKADYVKTLQSVCTQYKISTLFVQEVDGWKQSYSTLSDSCVKVDKFLDELWEDYTGKQARKALSFINWKNSELGWIID